MAKYLNDTGLSHLMTKLKTWAAATFAPLSHTHDYTKTRVKGNAESSYRTGDVNLTPANIGAAVQGDVNKAYSKVMSRGEQLVVNGSGMLGDNTNFSALTFDGSRSNGSPGSFTSPTRLYKVISQDELMSVDTSKEYVAEFDIMSDGEGSAAKMYGCLYFYDADKFNINIQMVSFVAGSTTRLARELKSGDTVVYLEDASGFKSTTWADQRALIFWDYTNSFGYTYPPETYSRNYLYRAAGYWENSDIDYSQNTITLSVPYTGATHAAGTYVSQNSSGGTYYYFWWNTGGTISVGEWMHASGIISGIGQISGTSTNPPAGKFWAGTAYVKIGFLWNYNSTASDLQKQLWGTNISLSEKRSASDIVPISKGGTGQTTAKDAANAFIGSLDSILSADVADTTDFITSATAGGTTTFYRRNATFVWNWIKSKISSWVKNNTGGAQSLGWTSATNDTMPVTSNTIAYWNGAYNSNNNSNLAYCNKGAFGTMATKNSLAASDIPSHASSATTYGTGSSSNYGHVKLSDSTSASTDTTGGTAATPKAVKAAYDLANGASTTAGQALSAATGALAFKVTYSVSGSDVVCAAHVYSAGSEVTSDHADSCFVWSMSLDGGATWASLGTGKTKTVSAMSTYGGNVKCDFTPAS